MSRDPKLISRKVDRALNRGGALWGQGIIAFAAVVQILISNSIEVTAAIAMLPVLLIAITVAVLRYFNVYKINFYPIIGLVSSHVLLIAFILFGAPVNGPYLFMWLINMFQADFIYGKLGSLYSLLAAIVTGFAAVLLRIDNPGLEEFVLTGAILSIIGAIGIMISNIREVSDEERKVLVVSMDKAQLERQRLLSLVNSMGDAVIATDEDGTIKLYNGATLDILDTNLSLDSAKIQDFLHLYDNEGNAVDLVKAAQEKGNNIKRTDLVMKFSEQDKVNLYVNVSPIKLGFRSNSERGFIMILRDITKEKSLEEERDEFISVVSHELRTPITITEAEISNAMLINSKQGADPKVEKALDSAHKQTMFLANMMNDLATLSRAQRDDLDVELEVIKPEEILAHLNENYQVEAGAKGLTLQATPPEGSIRSIITSKLYVLEILQNFITNSIKYTKEGGITLSVAESSQGVSFTVTDTGIGISTADQKKLFQKFFRSEDYRTRESSGTGLGLYVTLKLARRINAKITIESELNKGSIFTLQVPPIGAKNSDQHKVTTAAVDEFISQV